MKIHDIEKNIPIPELQTSLKAQLTQMDIGDSLLIEAENGDWLSNLKLKVGHVARYHGDITEKKFKTLVDHEANGVRIWRVE